MANEISPVNLAIYLVLAALAVFAAISLSQPGASVPDSNGQNDSTSAATAGEFLAAIDRFNSPANYTLVTRDHFWFDQTVKLTENGNDSSVYIATPFDVRAHYSVGPINYTCVGLIGSPRLACVNATTPLGGIIASSLLSNHRSDSASYRALLDKGAARITGAKGFAGYVVTVDFTKLNISDLQQFGISSRANPAVYNYVETHSIANGSIVSVKREYSNPTLINIDYTSRAVVSLSPPEDVSLPAYDVNGSLYNETISDISEVQDAYLTCTAVPNGDSCFKDAAVQLGRPLMCTFIANSTVSEGCSLIMAEQLGRPEMCASLQNTKDDCYGFLAVQLGRRDLCNDISADSAKLSCLKSVKPSVQYSECTLDSQCVLSQSQQLCIPSNVTDPTLPGTFACSELTTCTCAANVCAFNRTQDYVACLNAYEDEVVKGMMTNDSGINQTTNSTNATNASG